MQSFARAPRAAKRTSNPQHREAAPRSFLHAPQRLNRAACACGGTCPHCRGAAGVQTRLASGEAPRQFEQAIVRDDRTSALGPGPGSAATTESRPPSAILSSGSHSRLALQREADTTAVSEEGEEVPELSEPGAQAAADNPEDPDAALASIEQGAPFASGDEEEPAPEEETDGVQAKAASAAPREPVSPGAVLDRLGTGQPLPISLRGDMEQAFGHDFSDVRVHADSEAGALAATLGAHAFTVGEHIAFAPGRFRPHNSDARRLVAHELTHVVQQRHGLAGAILRRGIGEPGDVYEQEAERMADRISAKPDFVAERNSAQAGGAGAGAGALQLFSGTAAAAYAKKWALSTNPAYLRFDDDCTNFVSQSMEAGGWTYIYGSDVCDERKSDSVWWFEKDKCYRPVISNVHASFTWGGAQNFFKFASASGRATGPGGKISDLAPGDVLQRDHGDGKMHHSMVVTKKGTETIDGKSMVQIWLSYHTNDTEDRKFWGPTGILEDTTAGWKYYAWKIT